MMKWTDEEMKEFTRLVDMAGSHLQMDRITARRRQPQRWIEGESMKRLVMVAILAMACAACTDNQRARQFGGTATETLPTGQKLVMATWKQDNLWLLTRASEQGEVAESYEFTESSSFGIVQGKVVINEVK